MLLRALPSELLNPFHLTYVADDYHAIAFFTGHSTYECVEAMFSARGDGGYSARAILTRHDQSQVDHVNDDAALSAAGSLARVTVRREIRIALDPAARVPVAEVAFDSHANEQVLLRVACASVPDPGKGGLTDPGRHAIETSLPIMHRGASAVAAPASKVIIDGEAFPIPEIVRTPGFTAHRGYFTREFDMAAIRSGSRQLRVVRYPRSLARGEQWVYETDEGRAIHEIESVEADGRITIASRDSSQTIHGTVTSGGFVFTDVEVRSPRRQGAGARLKLTDDGRFAIGVNAVGEAVSGSAVRGPNQIVLRPDQPAWAVDRAIRVRWELAGDALRLETTCGEPDPLSTNG